MEPIVEVDQGKLKGTIGQNYKKEPFYKFQGIPYAKPPIGDLRFKAPEFPEKWTGVLDATKERDVCYCAEPLLSFRIQGTENCLHLNVFTRELPEKKSNLKPVMVFIHGGGYVFGSGNEEFYGPEFLMCEDIVLVTFNYRLGFLGFISFEDPSLEVPGNAGFKDQIMALRWVQKNISSFGGDPGNVTIFGESAGGMSVHLMQFSSLAKGLFHKAIAQSGSAFNPWLNGTKGVKHIAQALKMEGASEKEVYQNLMSKTVEELFQLQMTIPQDLSSNKERVFGLVVENQKSGAFMSENPMDPVSSGNFNNVPFMIGYNSREDLFFKGFTPPGSKFSIEDFVPWTFGYSQGTEQIQNCIQKLRDFYLKDGKDEHSNDVLDILSDSILLLGAYLTVIFHLKKSKSKMYLYRMTLSTNLNTTKKLIKADQFEGTAHMDDTNYLFNNFMTPSIDKGSPEESAMFKVIKLWTNFAKFGDPTPKAEKVLNYTIWKPVTDRNKLSFLEIGNVLSQKTNPDEEKCKFWKKLFLESPTGQKFSNMFVN